MQEFGDDREQPRFLPAMLRGGRRERAADLAEKRTARPKPSGLVEEIGHLRRQPPKPRARADDDRVIVSELLYLGNGRGLIELEVRFARDLLGHQLGHALDVNTRTSLPGPLSDSIRHRLDVAVGRVVENQNLRHDLLLDGFVVARRTCPRVRRS